MPLYDYVCRNCGHTLEVVHGINDPGPTNCPVCGGPLRKALSPPAIHFKGSGWAKKERSSKAAPAKTAADGEKSSAAPPAGAADGGTKEAAKPQAASTEKST